MGKGDYLKYSIEDINKALNEKGYIWIDGEYNNRDSKIIIEKDGFKGVCLIGTLIKGADTKFFFSKNPYCMQNIKKWISENTTYKLISTEYKDAYSPLTLICKEHGEFKLSWNKIYQGRMCQKCSNRNIKYTIYEIKDILSNTNPNIEVLSTEYVNTFDKLKFKCKIDGHIWYSTWHNILSNNNGCPECKRNLFIGESNPRYNQNLTDEEREKKRTLLGESYHVWRNSVFTRDKYTCQCCMSSISGTLNAHHLNGYNWDIENRVNIDNGVTLCEKCHKEFHVLYGYGDNTIQQYVEFKKINNKSA